MPVNQRVSFERILCPIDLTPDSDRALRYAIALAKAYDAKLFVIYCIDAYAIASIPSREGIRKHLHSSVSKYIGPSTTHAPDWEKVIVAGDPDVEIARVAAERRVDLIVMCSRRRPYAAALLGSTAESLCRTAPCPILVIHPHEQEWVGMTTNDVGLQRVLVAYDFSGDSMLALSYGLSLAQEYQATLHLLHVLQRRYKPEAPELAMLPLSIGAASHDVTSCLHRAVPEEARLWCDVKQALREGQPYREILAYAEEQEIDLICMGASGTEFGMQALFGSNADRVLRQAPCPVLIARPLKPMVLSSDEVQGSTKPKKNYGESESDSSHIHGGAE